jgi:hypothetical protein
MAHFAQLDENNVVTQVIVVNSSVLIDPQPVVINGVMYTNGESESKGIEFCKGLHGADTNWVQTSYNANFRGKYAGIGDTFDAENNVFMSPFEESVEVVTPVIAPVVMGETTHTIQTLTPSNVSALSTMQIAALNTSDLQNLDTSDLQSLTTTGL